MKANIKQDDRGTPYQYFPYNVSAKQVPSTWDFNKFGHNETVGTVFETLWSVGSTYIYPGSAFAMKASSGLAADSGATLEITGVDSAYDVQVEIVNLTGQTPVLTTAEFLRVYRARVLTHPAGVPNVGELFVGTGAVTNGVPAEKFTTIDSSFGQTLQAFLTVPRNHHAQVYQYRVFSNSQKDTTVALWYRPFGEVFKISDIAHFFENGVPVDYPFPKRFEAKTDFEIRARVKAGDAQISGGIDGIMVLDI